MLETADLILDKAKPSDWNEASHGLAKSMGFTQTAIQPTVDHQDGNHYNLIKYSLKL